MSAFIIDNKTMHRVVGFILNNSRSFCGIDTAEPKAGNEIGKILYALNTESVNYRYREEDAAPKYTYKAMPTSSVQAYKSISCLIYQCSEGEQFENSEPYKALGELLNNLAHGIVSRLPEYDQAKWG